MVHVFRGRVIVPLLCFLGKYTIIATLYNKGRPTVVSTRLLTPCGSARLAIFLHLIGFWPCFPQTPLLPCIARHNTRELVHYKFAFQCIPCFQFQHQQLTLVHTTTEIRSVCGVSCVCLCVPELSQKHYQLLTIYSNHWLFSTTGLCSPQS